METRTDEGNGAVPFFIYRTMSVETKTIEIQRIIEELLEAEPQYFLVRVQVRPINNISVFVDGDAGVTIEKCVQLNRALYKKIVEQGVCNDGEFSLEVSSPGTDEPLRMTRQYAKNIGRMVEAELTDGRAIEGKLIGADDKAVTIDEEKGKGKKKETIRHFIQYADLKSTTVKVVF